MDECFKCGISGNRIKLFEAIQTEGIIKICEKCASEEHIPIMKKPTAFQLQESEKEPLKFRDRVKKFEQKRIAENELLRRQETTLKDIVDRNVVIKAEKSPKLPLNLIDNFNWIIMRARRAKKLTQLQLAKELAEPEAAIRLAEKGIIPDDDYKLINKLESHLGVRLMRREAAEEIKQKSRKLNFDLDTIKTLTIADLHELKKKKDNRVEDEPEFNKRNLSEEEKKLMNQDRELSEEEIDDIIYGRK